jgi:hypothetical protein
MDGNRSGYVEFDDFKKFLFHNPYPYWFIDTEINIDDLLNLLYTKFLDFIEIKIYFKKMCF